MRYRGSMRPERRKVIKALFRSYAWKTGAKIKATLQAGMRALKIIIRNCSVRQEKKARLVKRFKAEDDLLRKRSFQQADFGLEGK